MATVEVTFTPLPAHVRTARLVATALARRSGVDESLLDEVRLAVGEACSRAVEAHRRHCPAEPVRIEMTDSGERFVVVVSDHAPTAPARRASPGPPSASAAQDEAGRNGVSSVSAGSDRAGQDNAGSDSAGQDNAGSDRAGHDGVVAYGAGSDGGSAIPAGFGLAVISGLADDVRVLSTSSGVSVQMSWPSTAATS